MSTLIEIGTSLLFTFAFTIVITPYIMGWAETKRQLLDPIGQWMRINAAAVKADTARAIARLDQEFALRTADRMEAIDA